MLLYRGWCAFCRAWRVVATVPPKTPRAAEWLGIKLGEHIESQVMLEMETAE